MNWNKIVREYFTYNRRERRGLSTLLVIICLLICLRLVIAFWPEEDYLYSDLQMSRLEKIATSIRIADSTENFPSTKDRKPSYEFSARLKEFSPQTLNPNEATVDKLVQTGLSKGSAVMLVKYVSAGGKIYDSKDLLKVYYMDTGWVEAMSGYFVFPENLAAVDTITNVRLSDIEESTGTSVSKERKQLQSRLDLNTADSIQLERIPGLGPFYVKEILRLREKLGGIRDYSQLLMIYKMRDETIDRVAENTFIDPNSFSYININQVSLDRLGRHPYITWRQAKTLINYRFQHGPFENLVDIKKCEVISDSTYQNLLPYLKLQ